MLNPGDVIGGCRVVAKLGAGAMGTVYRAEQLSLGRQVALKVMTTALQGDTEAGERFLREARTAAAVSHANVVSIFDVGRDSDRLYLVQELITGGSAKDLLYASGGFLGERRALELIADCCAGLQAIHEAGLVHRDIKPENILLTSDGSAKLADFGLARTVGSGGEMTMTGATIGTPAYMSPEQAQGRKDLDIRSDIFSLGATLYCLVTGSAPYQADSIWAIVAKMINDPVPDPRTLRPDLTDGAVAVIQRAMAKEPDERYPTPRLMRQVVENLIRRRGAGSETLPTALLNPAKQAHATTKQTIAPQVKPPEAKTAQTKRLPPVGDRLADVSKAQTEAIPRSRATGQGTRTPAVAAPVVRQAAAPVVASGRPAPRTAPRTKPGSGVPMGMIVAAAVGAAMLGALVAIVLLKKSTPVPTTSPTPPVEAAVPPAPTPAPTSAPVVPTPPPSAPQPTTSVAKSIPTTAPVVLIPRGSAWRYYDAAMDLGTAWHAPAFADSTWKHGPAPLGYGDPWIRTQVNSGADRQHRPRTTYFRNTFTVPTDRRFTEVTLSLMRDDGAVVYLDGREIVRSNLPTGVITFTTDAAVVVSNEDEQRFFDFTLNPADLTPGEHVMAVEIHQKGDNSSDLGFDLGLVGH
jgi:serine/threonine protein kinase